MKEKSVEVKVVAFGIAREILKTHEMGLTLENETTLGAVRNLLTGKFPELDKLSSLKFAVNESYQEDGFTLSANDEVVIIPPVSGG